MAKTRRRQEADDAGPQFSSDTTAATMDRERVAQRAYELYLARGGADGQDIDDWLCAERELSDPSELAAAEAHDRGSAKSEK